MLILFSQDTEKITMASAEELMRNGRNRALEAQNRMTCWMNYCKLQDELSYGLDLGYVGRADFDQFCQSVNQLNHEINTAVGDDSPAGQGIPPEKPAWTTKSFAHVNENAIHTWASRLDAMYAEAHALMNELGNEHYQSADDN